MNRSVLLWIDLTLEGTCDKTIRAFEQFFVVKRAGGPGAAVDAVEGRIDALCCDFDFPDHAGLQFLRATRRAHPSTPMIMLTVQHSEELAVWAFRSGVRDYLVKPVSTGDIQRCSESLERDMGEALAAQAPPLPPEAGPARHKDARISRAAQYVTGHLHEKLSEARLADMCGLSVYAFSRAFRAAFNQTFQSYVTEQRMERARGLLRNPNLRVADVAEETGFRDASYFGRVFRQRYEMTPTQWQQACQRERAEPETGYERRPVLRIAAERPRHPDRRVYDRRRGGGPRFNRDWESL